MQPLIPVGGEGTDDPMAGQPGPRGFDSDGMEADKRC